MATLSKATRLRSSRQIPRMATDAFWTTSVSSPPSTTTPSTRSPSTAPSLDCTFCGKLFPAYYLLCINRAELDDWRNVHYRCCYACATCHSEDFVWYSEGAALKPARLGARGAISGGRYNNFDRSAVADFDDDNENPPASGTSPSTRQRGPTPRSTSTRSGTRRDPDGHVDQCSDAKVESSTTSMSRSGTRYAPRSSHIDGDSSPNRYATATPLGKPCAMQFVENAQANQAQEYAERCVPGFWL